MLQHESQEQPTPVPAAQVRVTSEELAQAINALEASKDEAARRLAGTVPIGEVVEELKLEATPEEVWAQAQQTKAQQMKAQQAGVQSAVTVQVTVNGQAAALSPATRRRGMRALRDIKGWLWILFWCGGGLGLVSSVLHPSAGVQISGDSQKLTSATQGKNVEVSGDQDTLVLRGDCPTLTVSGDNDHIRVEGKVGRVITDGSHNTVTYTVGPAPAISGGGSDNQVEPSAP